MSEPGVPPGSWGILSPRLGGVWGRGGGTQIAAATTKSLCDPGKTPGSSGLPLSRGPGEPLTQTALAFPAPW